MNKGPVFSIVIPFQSWSPFLDECLSYIRQLDFPSFQVFLLPDEDFALPDQYNDLPIEVIPTGKVNPAVKRNVGAEKADGEFLAFIDDDAYPQSDWLTVADEFIKSHENVGAVGGPAITPKGDPFWARVSGAVFLSPVSGGFPERYVPTPPSRLVEDWPSVNLIVKSEVFRKVGGFDPRFWPGEDTLFCRNMLKETDYNLHYLPDLVVWHHRREELPKHLRQVGNYGLHRGFFAKRFPETSLKLKYFIPSLWVVFILAGPILAAGVSWGGWLYFAGWAVYLMALAVSTKDILRHESLSVAMGAIPYIMITHVWYGLKFFLGFTSKELKSSLGR